MIELEGGCLYGLTWSVQNDLNTDLIQKRLLENNFTPNYQKGFSSFQCPMGRAKVIVVLSSGRVQIRLHPTIPETQRKSLALELANQITSI